MAREQGAWLQKDQGAGTKVQGAGSMALKKAREQGAKRFRDKGAIYPTDTRPLMQIKALN